MRRCLLAAAIVLAGCGSSAHHRSPLVVVGTSDVYDSDLIQKVVKPGFEAANPKYTLEYVSKGSGAAIDYAKAGTASALLVHAASLENQFVADGYSAEPYGRALFWGDFVVLGPATDPAGVMAGAQHDVVGAFERIAKAGAAGRANFVSRGGTPGTTVAEHKIWALTKGVTLCTVSDDDGGGASPSATAGACPASIAYPSWYHATGLTQGPNITNADTCNYDGGHCYVLTDRGTFSYLRSTGAIHSLRIVTRDNADSLPGGGTLLVNSFHGYAVNPEKFKGKSGVRIDLPGATAFLDWVTSPAAQAAIGRFLGAGGDPPFIPSAAPRIEVDAATDRGDGFELRGSLANVVPGTPPLAGKQVTLSADGDAIASAATTADGTFVLRARAAPRPPYTVSTSTISQIENSTLSPVFGDLLSPASKQVAKVEIRIGR